MRLASLLYLFVLFAALWYGTSGCANISSPTGGLKDTIPPQLATILPKPGSINYRQGVIRMEFDEPVVLKNLQTQLIISPRTDIPYKTRVNKNVVELRFDKPLADSTTYTFNFREGIVDLTEGTPAKNLYLAFSTGAYLDSLVLQGQVKQALSDQPADGVTIGLYDLRDTAEVFTEKPLYFTKTDKAGNYEIRNLKQGRYLVYGFMDKNSNLTLQSKSEAYGFWPDTLNLQTSIDSVNFSLFSANADKPKIISARPVGGYYEVTFNKGMASFELQPQNQQPIGSNFIESNKKIRVYPFPLQDSLAATLLARDSLDQVIDTTLYLRFEESRRKKEALTAAISPKSGSLLPRTVSFEFTFNKPVASLNVDSLRLVYDSLHQERFTAEELRWNDHRDKARLQKTLEPPKAVQADLAADVDAQTLARRGAATTDQQAKLVLPKGSVIGIEGDTLDNQEVSYRIARESNTGIISGTMITQLPNYIVQLVKASNYQVVAEQKNAAQYTFRYVEPGEYRIRVIIDSNGNGRWDPGNIYTLEAPEPVIVNPEPISVKGNWEIQNPEIRL